MFPGDTLKSYKLSVESKGWENSKYKTGGAPLSVALAAPLLNKAFTSSRIGILATISELETSHGKDKNIPFFIFFPDN